MLDRVFPAMEDRQNETRDLNFWLWLVVVSSVLSLSPFIIHHLNLQPFERIVDLVKYLIPAFVTTALVPLRFRPAIFVSVFVLSVVTIFGWMSGGILLLMIAVCFTILLLPLKLYLKWLLLIGLLLAMAVLRAGLIQMPRIQMMVPYAAALIMFRSIIWLLEAKHHPMNENIWLRLSYFICLPNLAFLFFPIVDYRSHVQFYYNAPTAQIWRKGLVFIFSGIFQFILERVIHNYIGASVDQVFSFNDLVMVVLTNYVSLLQYSGTLTAAIGFLCLFGFNLPTPFGNFYFAESLFKYWQKVNIYWSEFILKIAYYPAYFSLRKKSAFAVELSLILAFAFTIFLHWYQKFWITGITKMPLNDVVFWSVLGVLITANALFNRIFPNDNKARSFVFRHLVIASKTTLVFIVMSTLTWFWMADSFQTNFYLLQQVFPKSSTFYQLPIVVATLYFVNFGVSVVSSLLVTKDRDTVAYLYPLLTGWVGLFGVALVAKKEPSDHRVKFITQVQKNSFERDYEEMDYYTSILDNTSGLWETKLVTNGLQKDLRDYTKYTDNLLMKQFIPNVSRMQNGVLIETNTYGMRDKEYSLKKPKDVYRIALLGASYEMGNGVDGNCVYETLVENKLNTQGKKIELLNFSLGGYTTLQHVYLMDTKICNFEPDAVIFFTHIRELSRYSVFFSRFIQNGIDLHYPFLKNIEAESGITQGMSAIEIQDRLEPYVNEIIPWTYDTLVAMCHQHNVRPIWMYAPTTNDPFIVESYETQRMWAQKAGFECYTIHDAFDGYTYELLRVSEKNPHPNCMGHELLAAKFLPIISNIDSTKNDYKNGKRTTSKTGL